MGTLRKQRRTAAVLFQDACDEVFLCEPGELGSRSVAAAVGREVESREGLRVRSRVPGQRRRECARVQRWESCCGVCGPCGAVSPCGAVNLTDQCGKPAGCGWTKV